jgi:lipopolysaccharide heptosyltransferase II
MPAPTAIPRRLQILQWLDRAAGPRLARLLPQRARALRERDGRGGPLPPEAVAAVLVIRPGGLGDAVLTWPLLRALREAFPAARIDLLAERRNAGAYQIGDDAPRVLCYDREPWATWRALRSVRYDLVVDTEQYHFLSIVLANALAPRWLCGFDTFGRGPFLTHPVAHSEDTYEALSFLALGAALTGRLPPFDPDRPFLAVSAAARAWAQETLQHAAARRLVTLMPGAGGAHRRWPAGHFADVARCFTERDCHVAILGGADALEAADIIGAACNPARISNLAGRTTVPQTAAVLARSCASLSADTGVLHIACGVGTPTVALFGAGLHRKWAPPGRRHRVVRKGLACSPCTSFGRTPPCPYEIACMTSITPAEVIAAMEDVLGSGAPWERR